MRAMSKNQSMNELSRMMSAFQFRHEQIKRNPSREIALIQAMKPFIDGRNHGRIDDMIEMMTVADMFKRVQGENWEDTDSIHEDGVYDMDKSCLYARERQKNPMEQMLMALILLKSF